MTPKVPSDAVIVRNARLAVAAELEKKRALNLPIAKFDAKTGRVYLEHADGTIEVVDNGNSWGRYSERNR